MSNYGERTDAALWSAATAGDTDAFGALFDRHARAVYNHSYRLTGSWTVAEETVSATFLTAWRRHSSIRLVHDSALPWLLTVALNVVRDERRRLRRRAALVEKLGAARRPGDERTPDHSDAVVDRLGDEATHRLLDAVRRLPRGEREAFTLCAWSGVSYPDAAAVLGIAEGSVRSRVSRARSRLRGQLGDRRSASLAPRSDVLRTSLETDR